MTLDHPIVFALEVAERVRGQSLFKLEAFSLYQAGLFFFWRECV